MVIDTKQFSTNVFRRAFVILRNLEVICRVRKKNETQIEGTSGEWRL
jgi:hypothetical protein